MRVVILFLGILWMVSACTYPDLVLVDASADAASDASTDADAAGDASTDADADSDASTDADAQAAR